TGRWRYPRRSGGPTWPARAAEDRIRRPPRVRDCTLVASGLRPFLRFAALLRPLDPGPPRRNANDLLPARAPSRRPVGRARGAALAARRPRRRRAAGARASEPGGSAADPGPA